MIIAIDGTAASGKSTTAKIIASELGIMYLDTGAMYRAVTLAVLNQSIDLTDKDALTSLLTSLNLEVKSGKSSTIIHINGKDVSDEIRSVQITEHVSEVSSIFNVREAMVAIQRTLGNKSDCVVEGRDIGTIVFPEAEFKFFMIADVETRARRRQSDLLTLGEERSLEELIKDLKIRDQKDSTRSQSPLTKSADAVEIDTTHFSIDEQVKLIVNHINSKSEQRKKYGK
jgi:cytidylate kinase